MSLLAATEALEGAIKQLEKIGSGISRADDAQRWYFKQLEQLRIAAKPFENLARVSRDMAVSELARHESKPKQEETKDAGKSGSPNTNTNAAKRR